MATTTATITLASSDIMDNSLAITNTSTLTKAGSSTGLADTTGLSRKRIASSDAFVLVDREHVSPTANKAAKLFIKNTGTDSTKYATISIGDIGGTNTILGRLYGGDWMFIPWAAAQGVVESFVMTFTGTWATADTLTFDGVTVTTGASTGASGNAMRAATYPNWIASGTADAAAVTFTARTAYDTPGVPDAGWFTISDDSGSDATISIGSITNGTDANDDIICDMSDATETVLEYIAIYE